MVTSHQTVRLGRGRHSSPSEGVCVMELASMLAGEPFTDRPASVCPVIAGFLRTYNDAVDDRRRQDLYEYASRVVGTRASSSVSRRRKEACLDLAAPGRKASPLRRWLTGPSAAGRAAARMFLTPAGPRHGEALAFVDRLAATCEPPAVAPEECGVQSAGANLARLDAG